MDVGSLNVDRGWDCECFGQPGRAFSEEDFARGEMKSSEMRWQKVLWLV